MGDREWKWTRPKEISFFFLPLLQVWGLARWHFGIIWELSNLNIRENQKASAQWSREECWITKSTLAKDDFSKRTAWGDLSSLGFQLYKSLPAIWFLTCTVVNMCISYNEKKPLKLSILKYKYSHTAKLCKATFNNKMTCCFSPYISAVRWSCLVSIILGMVLLLKAKGVLWRSQRISGRERMIFPKAIEFYLVSVWAEARLHWSFFPLCIPYPQRICDGDPGTYFTHTCTSDE